MSSDSSVHCQPKSDLRISPRALLPAPQSSACWLATVRAQRFGSDKFKNIQSLYRKSRFSSCKSPKSGQRNVECFCIQVKVEGDNEPQPLAPREEGMVPFVFVGTRENITNAKVLVEYHVAHLKVLTRSLHIDLLIYPLRYSSYIH